MKPGRNSAACFGNLPDTTTRTNSPKSGPPSRQMNRKQRRAEQKWSRPVMQPAPSAVQQKWAAALQHFQVGRLDEAERLFRQVLAVNPRDADSLHLLGVIAYQTGRHDLAADLIRKAIAINPREASSHSNLGNLLKQQGRLDEAVACYRRAIAAQAGLLGGAEQPGQRAEGAEAAGRGGRQLPHGPRAQAGRPGSAQQPGDGAAGARGYAGGMGGVRMALEDAANDHEPPRLPAAPVAWRGGGGADVADPCRAGIGRHPAVLPLCPAGGGTRAAGGPGGAQAAGPACSAACRGWTGGGAGEALPDFDLHCPMLSLPLALGTTIATIPGEVPYLRADAAQVAAWRTRLAALGSRALGSAWCGRAIRAATIARRRSIVGARSPRIGWRRCSSCPGLHFFSLQKDGPAAPARFPADRLHGRDGRLRRYRGADRQPRPGHLGRYRRCPSGGGAGQAGVAAGPLRSVLALARRAARQPVVSDACASIVSRSPATGTRSWPRSPATCAACRRLIADRERA